MKLRVLMVAYSCRPREGSEPGVGWNLAVAMAKHHEIWVLTRTNNRSAIEKEIHERPVPNLHFLYYDFPKWVLWWKRGGMGVQVYYYLWQLTAGKVAQSAHKKINFHISHHVTFVKYWAPAAAGFVGVPFIWGPVGGGESMPRSFFRGLSVRSKTHELLRLILRRISELDPWVRITAKRAKCAIGTTPATMDRIQRITQCPLMELSQVAISTDEWLHARDKEQKPIKDKLVFLSAGNLLGLKGYHLSIHAFARADLPDARYVILGDGPEKQNLKVLTRKLGIQDRVEIVGAVPRPEVLKRLGDTDVFLHPSLHDSGGFVTLEAMTAGVPVICLDIGGPAVQVNANVGRKIAAITPDQAIEDLAKAMRELVVDSDLRDRLGEAARQHVASEFTWEKKAEQLSKVYERVLS